MNIEFVSMLSQAQQAAAAGGIERVLNLAGGIAGVDPSVMDNIDIDYAFDKYSSLLNNDPKMIRSPEQLAAIRKQRADQQQQAQQADIAQKLSVGAANLSKAQIDPGNALGQMVGAQ